jgi:arylformamidase
MHFNPNGISLDKVPVERFFYQKPLVIDVPKKAGEKILTEDLIPYKDQIAQADFLFLRTGFWKKRKSDPSVYENNGPAVGSAAATYLRENFPNLKAIGLDFVSLASYSDGKDGDLAHQIMLGMYQPGYICIVEDINMEELPEGFLKQAAAVPLIIVGIDSCPVTMWAEF